jgi:hypothetical protein
MCYPGMGGTVSLAFESVPGGLKGILTFINSQGVTSSTDVLGSVEKIEGGRTTPGGLRAAYRWLFRNERHTGKEQQFLVTFACTETGQLGMGFYSCVIPVDDGTLRLEFI